jgi:hypothetical protein
MVSNTCKLLFLFLLQTAESPAQSDLPDGAGQTWQQAWQATMAIGDDDEAAGYEDYYDLLQELNEHPLDLNQATREDLERLPFLSAQQVMDLMEYRDRYGPIRSMGEMRAIRSMDYQQTVLLPYFCYAGEVKEEARFPRIDTIMKHGRQELTGAVRIPFYERKGDQNGYLGYRYRHWLRYQFHYGDYLKFGFVGTQDAGEPFFSNRNRWGYDAYSYYLQIRRLGCLDHAVVGKYKLSLGMGLVANNSFSLGKSAMLQNLGRMSNGIRPHASRSVADYFQGVAATATLAKGLKATLFASCRPIDATLNEDGSISTIRSDGYHRTPLEMEKKHNAQQTAAGIHIDYRTGGLHIGATTLYTQLDRTLAPDTKTLYRRHYAQGRHFLNSSVDYVFLYRRWTFSGETALSRNGAVATINALGCQPASSWSLMAVQRFYSYRYATLHGHAFSEGGQVQNESGLCLGGTWRPSRRLQLQGYADFAYFPWARYRVSQSSSAQDYLAEAIYTLDRHWTLKGRYRLHLRQLDNEEKTDLRRHHEHRVRLSAAFSSGEWSLLTQGDAVRALNLDTDHGFMVSENVAWKHRWWQLGAVVAWFRTDSYDSRIYTYERQLPHEFAFPLYYGKGWRAALVGRANIGSMLQLDAKLGHVHYNDRSVIGSGLQQVAGSSMTELDVQLRWRF